ncbi:MAG: hypothetical protein H6760_02850 [Candidatus Nomurabacteria bacterium]|nr:MAG: hypothetical protein H6760_02850 [Candidatus Nomurabacteria bacterium]
MTETPLQNHETPTLGKEAPPPPPPKPEVKPEQRESRLHRHNPGRILFGITLVIVGFLYLAETTGWVDVHFNLWELWPLAIVFLGISLITKSSWGTWVMVIVIILVAAGVGTSSLWINEREVELKDIDLARATDVVAADLTIDMGAGSLDMQAGDAELAQGTFKSDFTSLSQVSDVNADSVQTVEWKTQGNWSGLGSHINQLDLSLTRELPIDLLIKSGAMSMDLDFTEVMLRKLTIATGASSLNLTLGDLLDESEVAIDAGASSVDISVPSTLGVDVNVDAGLSSKNLDGFSKTGEKTYRSDNYDTAEKHLSLTLDLGVSSLNIHWD